MNVAIFKEGQVSLPDSVKDAPYLDEAADPPPRGEAADPPPAPGAGPSDRLDRPQHERARRMIDWDRFDQYIDQGGGKLRFVRNIWTGEIIGQLQTLTDDRKYIVSALCYCSKHETRCSRMRTWRGASIEPKARVDQVLVQWLLTGRDSKTTARHMTTHRY